MNITEFLLARIAEDEAVARAAYDHDPWMTAQDGNGDTWVISKDRSGQEWRIAMTQPNPAEHIARHDPERILLECAAKRAIVGLRKECQRESYENASAYLLDALNHLAAIYANHADYQQAWSVTA